jgi:predicted aconitase with swiveling domain
MQTDINQLYLYLNATVTGTEELTQEYSERQTADGLSGLIDGALTRVTKVQGNTVKSANIFDRYNTPKTGNAPIVENTDEIITVSVPNTGGRYVSKNFPIKNPEQYIGKTIYMSAKWTVSGQNIGGVRLGWLAGGAGVSNGFVTNAVSKNGEVLSGIIPERPEKATGLYVLLYSNTEGTSEAGDTVTYTDIMISTENVPYQPYFDGLKNSYFKGVKSTNSDNTQTDESFMLENAVELGEWDYIDTATNKLVRQTKTLTSETAFTEEQLANYSEYVLSVDGLKVAYKTENATETDIAIPTDKYQAWVGGSETQVQGDTDNSEYGANNTITQTYAVIKGGAE